jgi:hypothetical protein
MSGYNSVGWWVVYLVSQLYTPFSLLFIWPVSCTPLSVYCLFGQSAVHPIQFTVYLASQLYTPFSLLFIWPVSCTPYLVYCLFGQSAVHPIQFTLSVAVHKRVDLIYFCVDIIEPSVAQIFVSRTEILSRQGEGWQGVVSARMMRKSALFWGITRRRVVIVYGRFGTTYRSHPQGVKSPSRKGKLSNLWTLRKVASPYRCTGRTRFTTGLGSSQTGS